MSVVGEQILVGPVVSPYFLPVGEAAERLPGSTIEGRLIRQISAVASMLGRQATAISK